MTALEPRYPIYIVSKGRWESRVTHRYLTSMGVPHYMVVERSELAAYAAVVSPLATLLELDPQYQADYDTCDELGDTKSKGPGPARNFAWDHSIGLGAARHWVMDDNLRGFYRFDRNLKVASSTGAIFRAMEDFVDRYTNVAMAGPNYFMFVSRKSKHYPPFVVNTRIYSCNLIANGIPFRWRARYNEDTDLSLRILRDPRLTTVQFNAFLAFKMPTGVLAGGNTDAFYAHEGTTPKSAMLVRLHPDVARLVWRFGRPHHHVDYRPFKRNRLVLRDDVEIPTGVDEYGMQRWKEVDGVWVPE